VAELSVDVAMAGICLKKKCHLSTGLPASEALMDLSYDENSKNSESSYMFSSISTD
jgi:hypothetical protein